MRCIKKPLDLVFLKYEPDETVLKAVNYFSFQFLVASILFINPKELGLIPGFVRKLVKLRPLSRLCDEVRDLSYLFEDVLTPAGQTQLEQLNEVW